MSTTTGQRELVVPAILDARASENTGRPAIGWGDAVWTYEELADRAALIAHRLADAGAGPGETVALLVERSPAYVAALWAVLKTGAVCLPLDPAEPAARLRTVLERVGARFAVTRGASRHAAALADGAIAVDADVTGAVAPRAADYTGPGVEPSDIAFVFATSGSTGEPKGVMLSHCACCMFIPWVRTAFGLTPEDRHLFKTSVSFVSVLRQVLWPLATGGYTAVLPAGEERDLRRVADAVERERISILTFIPSALQRFLDHADRVDIRGVRQVLAGGEPISRRLQERFFAATDAELHNLYAATEAPLVTHWRCNREDDRPVAPIGRPIPGTDVVLLDDAAGAPAAAGEPGELYVGGPGVAHGYVNAPALTAERFGQHPVGESDERYFRSGDLARVVDGELHFVGRSDDLVKVRGFRIEPGEVHAALAEHRAIRQSHVTSVEVADGDRRLVAYLVPEDDALPGREELREFLERRLPRYMVPALFVRVDAIPLMPTGKVDPSALPRIALDERLPHRLFDPPRDELERAIAAIWERVLRVAPVGLADDFVDLGGDSLLAMEVLDQIERALGVEVPLEALAETPTVAALAAVVRERPPHGDTRPTGSR